MVFETVNNLQEIKLFFCGNCCLPGVVVNGFRQSRGTKGGHFKLSFLAILSTVRKAFSTRQVA